MARRWQLLQLGYTRNDIDGMLERGELIRVYRTIYRAASVPISPEQGLMAVQLWAGPRGVFSHLTAGELLGLDGLRAGTIEITTPHPRRPPGPGVIVHVSNALSRGDVARVGPFRVTAPPRTLLDLGAVVDEETVEIALDCALRRRMTSYARLNWRLAQLGKKGRRGAAVLRRILAERDPKAAIPESTLETKFARFIRKRRLPRPVPQHPEGTYRIDFAYPALMIAIEMDGYDPHRTRRSFEHDRERQNHLVRYGWLVLRFTWSDLAKRPGYVEAEIRAAIERRQNEGFRLPIG